MKTYGEELDLLKSAGADPMELVSKDGNSRVMIVPRWQGRVMTSTATGKEGTGYGWINHEYIASGAVSPQFNPYGGEERFWIGPEGGPFSWFFRKGVPQTYENWMVPAAIDTAPLSVSSRGLRDVTFAGEWHLTNASGVEFAIGAGREVTLLKEGELSELLGTPIAARLKAIAYRTDNTLTNLGTSPWTKRTGMPSVWILGMFPPNPSTTVFIPYDRSYPGTPVKDDYFGKIPSDRLTVENGVIYFRIDGKFRSKLGLPSGSASGICGSYDSENKVLNILKHSVPENGCDYVNSQWGEQEDHFHGDVINSYNDGPTETGAVMGPFYEVETSSPAAALKPGESLTHTQHTIHIQGDEEELAAIALKVFGVRLSEVTAKFR